MSKPYNNYTKLIYDECYKRPNAVRTNNNYRPKPVLIEHLNAGKLGNERVLGSESTHYKGRHETFLRPYLCCYRGAGTSPASNNIVLETALIQGINTNFRDKAIAPVRDREFNRFDCLPAFGNPQRVIHIIEPSVCQGGWIRGGSN